MKTLFYHGTDIDSAKAICDAQKVDISKCSSRTDFGQGFYISNDYESAVKWAKRKARLRGKAPAVITVYFDVDKALPYIEKFSDDLRWGRFIINNRNGLKYINKIPFKENNLDARYAITYGRIADVDIIDVAKELNDTNRMLMSIDRILNNDYAFQYAFHTDEATRFITKMSYQSV